jgi:hypothetical protein
MAIINAAQGKIKTVADPNASYESLRGSWVKCKAVCSGERFVKDLDQIVNLNNLLIPFSPSMSQQQYDFYKSEAELPGITAQFSKMLIGGLLRKSPTLTLPKSLPEEAHDWITNQFGQDDSTLISFLDAALWEEVRTSRCWVYVDHPTIVDDGNIVKDDLKNVTPYPIIWSAETVINWKVSTDSLGKTKLERVILRGYTEDYSKNEFHPDYVETIWVHELENGQYQIRIFVKEAPSTDIAVIAGAKQQNTDGVVFKLEDTITNITSNGKRLNFIPAWPLNGNIEATESLLSTIVDKEISLYNKISRRNHLLYGAATYTPVIISDMEDGDFDRIVEAGLGSWIKLDQGDKAEVLATPTEALQDMDRAIAASIEEIAKLGIRMLTPESDQSGVALQLRNASQTAQLGTLNTKVSGIIQQVIAFMLEWRYGTQVTASDVDFKLSADFNPSPIGADWLRLATEWYQAGLIPRTIWLNILKQNDMLDPDYDDKAGTAEINSDELILPKPSEDYLGKLKETNE